MKSFWIGAILVSVAAIGFAVYFQRTPGNLEPFAQCLGEKGAVFYGAFWCPHCQEQKRIFGRAERALPYFECSTPDGRGQISECNEKEISNYPTWIYADGTRDRGVVSLEKLAEKTGCELPSK